MKTIYGLIFYKLTWLDDITKPSEYGGEDVVRNRGYYLIKRWYMWIIFAPIIILIKWIYEALCLLPNVYKEYFRNIFTYRVNYINPKQDKLKLRTKLNYIKRLL